MKKNIERITSLLKRKRKKKQEKNSRLLFGLPSTFCKLVITILALRNLFHRCNTQYCCLSTCTPVNWRLSDTTPFCQLILLVFNMFVVIYELPTQLLYIHFRHVRTPARRSHTEMCMGYIMCFPLIVLNLL